MDQGEESEAGTDAGAEKAEPVVTLALKPPQRAADVQDCLAAGLQGQPDIRADEMIGARMAGNGATIVIRKTDFHGSDTQELQPAADILLLFPTRIPLGENDDGGAMTTGLEQLSVNPVVFGPG